MRRALPILLAALAAGGCGGGETPAGEPPEQWAAEVCGSLEDWRETLEERQRELSQSLSDVESLEEAKRRLLAFLEDVSAETDDMLVDVDAAGTPAVEDGEALAQDMRNGLDRLDAAFDQARERTQQLDTADPQQFQRDVAEIGERLTRQGAAIEETFDGLDAKYDVPQLDEAFEEQPACRSLQSD